METVIEARSLTKKRSNKQVLSKINFEVKKGHFLAVVGNEGSGKSELVKVLINGALSSTGDLYVLGLNAKDNYLSIKQKVGYVPSYSLLDDDFTVLDNLLIAANFFGFSKKNAILKSREILRSLNLDDAEGIYVQNLTEFQKQCLTIAKALINNPEILFIDEPFANRSESEVKVLIQFLKKCKLKKITVVCTSKVTQPLIELADRVLFLAQGKKLIDGEPQDIIEETIGNEVIEFKANKYERDYYIPKIKNKFDYIISQNHVYVFVKHNQNTKEVIKLINSDYIQVRKASLFDAYLKLSGFKLS